LLKGTNPSITMFSHKKSVIVFIGPDGCGKTTLINRLRDEFFTGQYVEEKTFSFGILPSLSSLIGREREIVAEGTPGAGMKPPLPWLRTHILLLWYGLDFILARFLKRPSHPVIFSRFFYDFFYQRAHRRAARPLIKLFRMLGPKPDFVFLLKRDPKAIFEQKPELDEAEIALQYRRIEEAFAGRTDFHIIDANDGIDATAERLFKAIENGEC